MNIEYIIQAVRSF